MLEFDYREAVKKDIFECLKEEYMNDEIFDYIYKDENNYFVEFNKHFVQKITEEAQETLTGKCSVNYVCSKEKAKECVLADGIDILNSMRFDDLIDRETIAYYFLDENWQAMDAECRWYCCFEMAQSAVDEFEEYLNEDENALLEKIYVSCGGCDNE